ncbi:MAG: 50S ribosomal protein L30 [archaeon]
METEKKETHAKNVPVKIAVVRIRGDVGLNPNVRKTFELLRLYKKNYCVVLPTDKSTIAMVQRVKDFVAFGEISKETFAKLLQHRGKLAGDKPITENFLKEKTKYGIKEFVEAFYDSKTSLKEVPSLKQYFRLHPPIGGFEKGGIKKAYAEGGVLGYRGKEIDKLIERMIK